MDSSLLTVFSLPKVLSTRRNWPSQGTLKLREDSLTALFSRWKKEYLATASKGILAETLSPTFVGLSFQEAAEICYTRLNLVLVAVEARKYEGGDIWINPRNRR